MLPRRCSLFAVLLAVAPGLGAGPSATPRTIAYLNVSAATGPRGFNTWHVSEGWRGHASRTFPQLKSQRFQGVMLWMPWGGTENQPGNPVWRWDEHDRCKADPRTRALADDWKGYCGYVEKVARMMPADSEIAIYLGSPEETPGAADRLARSESEFRSWITDRVRPEREIQTRLGRPIRIYIDASCYRLPGSPSDVAADQLERLGFLVGYEAVPTRATGSLWAGNPKRACTGIYTTLDQFFKSPECFTESEIAGPIWAICLNTPEAEAALKRGWNVAMFPWDKPPKKVVGGAPPPAPAPIPTPPPPAKDPPGEDKKGGGPG